VPVPNKKTDCSNGWPRICQFLGIIFILLTVSNLPAVAGEQQFVLGHLPSVIANQHPVGRVPAAKRMDIAFGLPLRNPEGLTNLLREIYRAGSPSFHQYLTPEQFTASFGPSEADYQAVIRFANAHGLTITGIHANRTLIDANGKAGDIENALHVHLCTYRHPTEHRTFFAPDAQPWLELSTPVLAVGGLHDYTTPYANLREALPGPPVWNQSQNGSGTNGSYLGGDFRAAYLPGVSLTGAGETVGLFELDGYNVSDITNYEYLAGVTNLVPLQNVLVDGFSGVADGSGETQEACVDIEMAIAMAPGLSNIIVYEGNQGRTTFANDVLNRMATDNRASQLASCYLFDINASTEQIFQQFAAQGQTFLQSSGDTGAYPGAVTEPADDPNVTVVGGTILGTSGPLGPWASEVTWNTGTSAGSSGGVSTVYPIPYWQQGLNLSGNQGSATMRNLPDVAMVAQNVLYKANGTIHIGSGTSIATPLWAGFAALINQQAALNQQPPLGFANPAIYALGRNTNYGVCFHDITTGNNTNTNSLTKFYAVPGYDLCTGWGTPASTNLISALLAAPDALVVTPGVGITATGPVGGPFDVVSRSYTVTNAGSVSLPWSLSSSAAWLSASQSNGSLASGASTTVMVGLNSGASNLLLNDYVATIAFTNLQDNSVQSFPIVLDVGNGGFERGSFSEWTFTGDTNFSVAVNVDDSNYAAAGDPLPGISYSQFVHSGLYGAFLGQSGSLGSLSQVEPTVPNQYYLLSCWLSSFPYNGQTTPNEFRVQWNGNVLADLVNVGVFGWTNLFYMVKATGTATTLEFDFRDDPAALALDDISIQAINPVFQSVTQQGATLSLTWSAVSNLSYQLQYSTNLDQTNWVSLGGAITASNNFIAVTNITPAGPAAFYRFTVAP